MPLTPLTLLDVSKPHDPDVDHTLKLMDEDAAWSMVNVNNDAETTDLTSVPAEAPPEITGLASWTAKEADVTVTLLSLEPVAMIDTPEDPDGHRT